MGAIGQGYPSKSSFLPQLLQVPGAKPGSNYDDDGYEV
jgi:hypothetical protein